MCGQARNALLELVPLKVKIEEDMEQQEFQCHLPCTRVCTGLQTPFTMLTMALHFNPGLMNDVVRQNAHLMSSLAGKSKDRESNERQRLAEVVITNEHRDMTIKLVITVRKLGDLGGR